MYTMQEMVVGAGGSAFPHGQIRIAGAATELEAPRFWNFPTVGRGAEVLLANLISVGNVARTARRGTAWSAADGTIQVALSQTEVEAVTIRVVNTSFAETGIIQVSPTETELGSSPLSEPLSRTGIALKIHSRAPSSGGQRRAPEVELSDWIALVTQTIVLTTPIHDRDSIALDITLGDWLGPSNNLVESIQAEGSDALEARPLETERNVAAVLARLKVLPENWNAEGGKPVSPQVAEIATLIISQIAPRLREPPFLYPTPQGGAILEVQFAGDRLSIIIENDFILGVAFVDEQHYSREFKIPASGEVGDEAITWLWQQLGRLGQADVPA
jgi:hypothetical protein